jgi:hypothetical protein
MTIKIRFEDTPEECEITDITQLNVDNHERINLTQGEVFGCKTGSVGTITKVIYLPGSETLEITLLHDSPSITRT